MDIDYNTFRGIYTGFLLFLFIGIFIWAYSKKRKSSFDEAANLIFDHENTNEKTHVHQSNLRKHDS